MQHGKLEVNVDRQLEIIIVDLTMPHIETGEPVSIKFGLYPAAAANFAAKLLVYSLPFLQTPKEGS